MRLTEKDKLTSGDLYRMEMDCDLETVAQWHNKLSQLEDKEDRFGIDLLTLCLLLEKQETDEVITIYYKRFGQIKEEKNRFIVNVRKRRVEAITYITPLGSNSVAVRCPNYRPSYAFCEYGKTWALTKEELE